MMAEAKLAVAAGKAAVCRWVLVFGLMLVLKWEKGAFYRWLPRKGMLRSTFNSLQAWAWAAPGWWKRNTSIDRVSTNLAMCSSELAQVLWSCGNAVSEGDLTPEGFCCKLQKHSWAQEDLIHLCYMKIWGIWALWRQNVTFLILTPVIYILQPLSCPSASSSLQPTLQRTKYLSHIV